MMRNEIIQEEESLSTAQLVRRTEAPDGAAAAPAEGRAMLFPVGESESFRQRWHDIQGGFVDEPQDSVKKADELVASVIQRLAEVFSSERSKLESGYHKEGEVSTEDLRQALRHYRSFFDRLLSV